MQVAEATKRTRYKTSGYDEEEELHQYVDMSINADAGKGKGKGKGPRVINLDDHPSAPASIYQPPNTLTIHLSKISMPELEPKMNKSKSSKPSSTHGRRVQAPSDSSLASDLDPSKASKPNKQGWRQSSVGVAPLAPPSQSQTPFFLPSSASNTNQQYYL